MTKPSEADAEHGAEPAAAAWLAIPGETTHLAPLSGEQCVFVAGAVLSTATGTTGRGHPYGPPPYGPPQSLAERLAVVAGRVAAVAAWLPADAGNRVNSAVSAGSGAPWTRQAIVTPCCSRSSPQRSSCRARSGRRLAATVRRWRRRRSARRCISALAHGHLRQQFDRRGRGPAGGDAGAGLRRPGMRSTIRSPTLPRGRRRSCWRRPIQNAAAGCRRSLISRFGLAT